MRRLAVAMAIALLAAVPILFGIAGGPRAAATALGVILVLLATASLGIGPSPERRLDPRR